MPKNEYIHDKKEMVKFTRDYLVDEIHRLQRKCQRYEKRLTWIWNDDTIFNLQKRIEEFERKELKAKLQIISKDSPIINLIKQLKKEKDINNTELAKILGVNKSRMSRWINAKDPIPFKRQRQIHKLFKEHSV